MLRTLIGVMTVAVLSWTGSALALGLGEIEAKSKLNQPLSALIPVSTATPKELESLVVELASNEDFERSGMERSEYLSTLRFEIQGNTIRVTSKQMARDPFVSFLLNVRWDGGRLLREYTLLLDPPTMAEQKKSSAPAPAPVKPAPPAPVEQVPADTAVTTAEPEYVPPPDAPATPAPVAEAPATTYSSGTYGPIQPQETLWSIAYRLRPDPNSVTMDQMQVAIFNANPQAFHGGRLNGLMKGSVLRVPTLDEIRTVNPAAAKSQVANARSASYQPPAAAPAPVIAATPSPAPAEPAAAPEPTAAVEPKAEPKPEPAPPPVAEPAPVPASEAPASSPPPPPETAQAPPSEAAAAPAETPATPPPEQTAAAPAPVETAPPPAPVIKEPKYNVDWKPWVSSITDRGRKLLAHPFAIPAAAVFFILLFVILAYRKLKNKYAQWSYNRASAKMAAKSAASTAAVAETHADKTEVQAPAGKSTLDVLQDEAATVVNTARRAAATQAMSATATQSKATQSLQAQSLEATQQSTLQQTQIQEPAAATSGARQVDFDVTGQYTTETVQINLEAGDPVSEAEFHRAYGLYDEAALLLKQALQKDPKRTDARVKLAEIYFESSKASEFVGVAKELKDQLPEAEWQKIALLGSQIAPTNDLFKGAAAGGAGGAVDLSFDEPAASPATGTPASAPAAAASAPAADSGMLDFKLEDFQMPAAAPATPPAAAAPADAALEFDLGGLSLDTPAAPITDAGAAGGEVSMEGLDLGNFDLGDASAAPAGGESIELSAEMPMEPAASAGGGDDSGTKLDLARAYVEMGDNDMAKSLLNEVLQQGNDQQKKEAQELLQRVPA